MSLRDRIFAVRAELEALEREADAHVLTVLGQGTDAMASQVVAATRVHGALSAARWQLVGLGAYIATSEGAS